MSTTVFISGATGFIAQQIVKDLIQKGYKVVGTVRSTEKGDRLKANLKSDNFTYEIVKDIAAENAFDEALKKHPEVSVFLHTASPFQFHVDDVRKDVLEPAVNGTINALTSIKKYGPQIKRVVVTSSYAAIASIIPDDSSDAKPLTEDSWNPVTYEQSLSDPVSAYVGSKKLAEKAAWDFVEKEKPNFTLNVVNPVYVFGPQAFDSEVSDTLNASSEMVNAALKGGVDGPVGPFAGLFIDVRDVSRAHIYAFESKDTNTRYVVAGDVFNGQIVSDIINANFPELKGKIPVGKPGSSDNFKWAPTDFSKTEAKLGKYIGLKQSIIETIRQIVDSKK